MSIIYRSTSCEYYQNLTTLQIPCFLSYAKLFQPEIHQDVLFSTIRTRRIPP